MKTILIDDEHLALQYLAYELKTITNFHIVDKFTDPYKAREMIKVVDVDVVFLDINMPEINGIELAEQLLEIKPNLHIVFVTAHEDYAIKAFELNALDYVMKPISHDRLKNTIARIKKMTEHKNSQPKIKSEVLHIQLFNRVTMSYKNEKPIQLNWRTAKVQQLFLYLLHHKEEEVLKDTIIELLWSDLEPKRASSQMYTAIYNIRKTLAPFSDYFKVRNTSDGYLLSLNNVFLDVHHFDQFIHENLSITEQTITEYEQVINLYKGQYLEGYDYFWAENERHRLQLMWLQTSLDVAVWYYENKQFDHTINLCTTICQHFLLEEKSYFLLLKAYAEKEDRISVLQTYDKLKELLEKELAQQPSDIIKQWYRNWSKAYYE